MQTKITSSQGPYSLTLDIPGLPKMMNPSGAKSTHWRVVKKERDFWKYHVAYAALGHRPHAPLKKALLKLTRFSSVCPDPDNLVSGFKAVIDGLVTGRVLENDRWDNIGMPTYDWVKAPQKSGAIRIEVWDMQPV